MTHEFRLPDLGEGVHEGQIIRIHVKQGDTIREDEPLMDVETDKAAVEIPSPYSGVVQQVLVEEQQLVHVGDVMVTFGETADSTAPTPVAAVAATASASAQATQPIPAAPLRQPARRKPASPAVRKFARSVGVDLEMIVGSGPGGRVTRADVESASRGATAAPIMNTSAPPLDAPRAATPPIARPALDGTERREPMTQARKTIARVMSQSWTTIPHVTDCHDADVTELDRLRRGYESADRPGRKLTLLSFIIRSVATGLERFPIFNTSFDADAQEIIYHGSINIAIGVHTERGLVAPVIRDANQLSILQITDALAGIAEKARTATFAVNDTRGGTYTISNPGALGTSRYSTPLINPPQVAVLGVGRAKLHPWVVDGAIVPRLILPLSHSFDHRVVDGGDDLAFMRHVVGDLEHAARLMLGD